MRNFRGHGFIFRTEDEDYKILIYWVKKDNYQTPHYFHSQSLDEIFDFLEINEIRLDDFYL